MLCGSGRKYAANKEVKNYRVKFKVPWIADGRQGWSINGTRIGIEFQKITHKRNTFDASLCKVVWWWLKLWEELVVWCQPNYSKKPGFHRNGAAADVIWVSQCLVFFVCWLGSVFSFVYLTLDTFYWNFTDFQIFQFFKKGLNRKWNVFWYHT